MHLEGDPEGGPPPRTQPLRPGPQVSLATGLSVAGTAVRDGGLGAQVAAKHLQWPEGERDFTSYFSLLIY